MAKILFVNPSAQNDFFSNVPSLRLPPLNLAMLAGLTPKKYEMEIIDEAISSVSFSEDADLVAVTAMTTQAPRAYEICSRFRRRGVPVVMGGIHASMMPEEAGQFADAVVVGEAEETWQTLISDWEHHKLKPRYTSEPPSLKGLPFPRRDLLGDGYFIETVQTSRGCPFDCRFCSVSRFNGRKYRHRPVNDVIEEISILNGNRFFFNPQAIASCPGHFIKSSPDPTFGRVMHHMHPREFPSNDTIIHNRHLVKYIFRFFLKPLSAGFYEFIGE